MDNAKQLHPQSLILAQRLKKLRETNKLSHVELSKALKREYNVNISKDSLINYEVTDPHHTRANKNLGMNVEFLTCLADFYGVTTDYLLGLSDVPTLAVEAAKTMATKRLEDAIRTSDMPHALSRNVSDIAAAAMRLTALDNIQITTLFYSTLGVSVAALREPLDALLEAKATGDLKEIYSEHHVNVTGQAEKGLYSQSRASGMLTLFEEWELLRARNYRRFHDICIEEIEKTLGKELISMDKEFLDFEERMIAISEAYYEDTINNELGLKDVPKEG